MFSAHYTPSPLDGSTLSLGRAARWLPREFGPFLDIARVIYIGFMHEGIYQQDKEYKYVTFCFGSCFCILTRI
jgi:hypothetical protein